MRCVRKDTHRYTATQSKRLWPHTLVTSVHFAELQMAVIYQEADYRSAIVVCPKHVSMVVYQRANVVFELYVEAGWIWAEATGNTKLIRLDLSRTA